MNRLGTTLWVGLIAGILGSCAAAGNASRTEDPRGPWPLVLWHQGVEVLVYQPQPEELQGTLLTARTALSVIEPGHPDPSFGWARFRASTRTDRDERTVVLADVEPLQVSLPDSGAAREREVAELLRSELPNQRFPLDELVATLDGASVHYVARDLRNDPPHIVLTTARTALLTVDGPPQLEAVRDSRILRVVNTPFVILFDPATKTYWFKAGDAWASGSEFEGIRDVGAVPPPEVNAAVPPPRGERAPEGRSPAPAPERILVACEPTELVVCRGTPRWTPLVGNDLMSLANSESDAFLDVGTQQVYLLLGGRWYRGPSLERGPWTFVPSDALPQTFARIPASSPKASVRTFVAGTQEARDAVRDALLPQTAAIRRADASCTTVYDGEPRFAPIEGTSLRYAVNTGSYVVQCAGLFYCCSDGVWFVSDGPAGPWSVCTSVPEEIYAIPPSCPLYPVRYVYVYSYTPDVVYVGYLPGYLGCYVIGPTIVYGTGWWYPGWYGTVYFPRPCTWGFHPYYDPWFCTWHLGLEFGWGVSPGWFALYFGWGYPGWWGPAAFRCRYFDLDDLGPHFHPWAEPAPARRTATALVHQGHENLYTRARNETRLAPPPPAPSRLPAAPLRPRPPNDLYIDGEGHVLRHTVDGWQQVLPRRPGAESQPPAIPARPVPGTWPRRDDFERMRDDRLRGATRSQVVRPPRSRPRPE